MSLLNTEALKSMALSLRYVRIASVERRPKLQPPLGRSVGGGTMGHEALHGRTVRGAVGNDPWIRVE
jgi:hypothetical protein